MNKALATRIDPMHAMAVASQTQLMDAVTRFGGYVDRTGVAAPSGRSCRPACRDSTLGTWKPLAICVSPVC